MFSVQFDFRVEYLHLYLHPTFLILQIVSLFMYIYSHTDHIR